MSIAAFAVPAYKKTQKKAQYNAAAGVLVQLGTAVQNLRLDLEMLDSSKTFPLSTSRVALSADWSDPTKQMFQEVAAATNLLTVADTNEKLGYALVARGYMSQFPSTTDTFNGYTYYICPQKTSSSPGMVSSDNCCSATNVIVCMSRSGESPTEAYSFGKLMNNGAIVSPSQITSTPGPVGPVH